MVFSKLTLPLAAFVATTEAKLLEPTFNFDNDFHAVNDAVVKSDAISFLPPAAFSGSFSVTIDQASAVNSKGLAGYGGGVINGDCTSEDVPCHPGDSSFRRYNGRCNNLGNPSWGSAGETMPRGFFASQGGGKSTDPSSGSCSSCYNNMRFITDGANGGTVGGTLRSVSDDACKQGNDDTLNDGGNPVASDSQRSDATITWAQLMDHDFDATTPLDPKPCANAGGNTDGGTSHALGGSYNLTVGQDRTCRIVKNVITSYIDAGILYGESVCERDRLFDMASRRVRATLGTDGEYLPTGLQMCPGGAPGCTAAQSGVGMANPTKRSCFYAGDFRAGENPALAAYHTMFLRLHNYYVDSAPGQNFEIYRAKVIVDEQNITYNEWLPAYTGAGNNGYRFSGSNIYAASGIGGVASGGYDVKIRGSVRQQFATGTFRQHTGVSGTMQLDSGASLELDQSFFETCVWYSGGGAGCNANKKGDSDIPGVTIASLCDILAGQSSVPMRVGDTRMVTEERNQLFYKKDNLGNNSGEGGGSASWEGNGPLDLASMNLFRGRDHDIATWTGFAGGIFNAWWASYYWPNQWCRAWSIGGCTGGVGLSGSYTSRSKVDLWVGALAEPKLRNSGLSGGFTSALGSTLTRDVVTQSADVKRGDRFFSTAGGKGLHEVLAITTGAKCSGKAFRTSAGCRCGGGNGGGGKGGGFGGSMPFDESMPRFRRRLNAGAAIFGTAPQNGSGECGNL